MAAKLIVLESCDGAGKTTQMELVKKYLDEKKLKYVFFHFPAYNHNEFSKVIAAYLRGEYGSIEEVDPYFVANIYAMDRFLFFPKLKKMMEENDVVLLDRYVLSNVAFQGAKYKYGSKECNDIKHWILDLEYDFLGLPWPDINIYFDLPIDVIKDRLNVREQGDTREYLNGKKDIHEASLELQTQVRQNYLSMVDMPSYRIVECAVKLGSHEKPTWFVFPPEELFKRYKDDLDYILDDKK